MNRFGFICFASFLLVVFSCSKQDTDIVSSEHVSERVPSSLEGQVIFSLGEGFPVSVDAATKAQTVSESDLNSGFNVSCVKGTPGSDVSVWTSTLFEKVGNYWTGGKWWPNTDESYRFYAVYPSSYSISYASSGSTIAASNSNDVVVAYKASSTFNDVNELEFEHIFARIGDVTVVSDGGYDLSNISITIVPKVSGTYNLRTKAWSSVTAGSSTVIGSSVGTVNRDLLLVPGTYEVTASWTASHGSYSENFSGMVLNVNLPVGKISNITFGLTGDGPTVNLSVSMSNWSSTSSVAIPPTEAPYLFRVASNKLVEFSPGHLQAHISACNSNLSGIYQGRLGAADMWRFADPEWDYSTSPYLTVGSWTSHFSYCGNTALVSTYGLFYCGSAYDSSYTGTNPTSLKENYGSIPELVRDCGEDWDLLTNSEWSYLCNSRTTGVTVNGVSNARYTMAKIRSDVDGGVLGLILFPEGYSGGTPDGVAWGTINGASKFDTQCTASGWDALSKAGCVFLVALGDISGYSVSLGQGASYTIGTYWAKNATGSNNWAYSLIFSSYNGSLNVGNVSVGGKYGVRLVRVYD